MPGPSWWSREGGRRGLAAIPWRSHHSTSYCGRQVWQKTAASSAPGIEQCPLVHSWGPSPSGPNRAPLAWEHAACPVWGSLAWNRGPIERRSEPHPQPGKTAGRGSTGLSGVAGTRERPPSLGWCRAASAWGCCSPSRSGWDGARPLRAWSWWSRQGCSDSSDGPLGPGEKHRKRSTQHVRLVFTLYLTGLH